MLDDERGHNSLLPFGLKINFSPCKITSIPANYIVSNSRIRTIMLCNAEVNDSTAMERCNE